MAPDHALLNIGPFLASPFLGWSTSEAFYQRSLDFRPFISCGIDEGDYVLVSAGELSALYLRFHKLAKIIWEFLVTTYVAE